MLFQRPQRRRLSFFVGLVASPTALAPLLLQLLLLVHGPAPAAAHGIMTKIVVASTSTYSGYDPDFQYSPTPVPCVGWSTPKNIETGGIDSENFDKPDIICHLDAKNAELYASVKAGEVISLTWSEWPDSHHGPMMDYLAPCGDDCTTIDKTKLEFFRIDGVGMIDPDPQPPLFGSDLMIDNKLTWNVKIPENVKPGKYVLRHETIALHLGEQLGKAQAYPQCVNLEIAGDGADTPDGVLGTKLYTENDPGIHFDLYRDFTSVDEYTFPGPPLIDGADSGEEINGKKAKKSGASGPQRGAYAAGTVISVLFFVLIPIWGWMF